MSASNTMQQVSIPYSCRAGSCSNCIGLVKSGSVDQSTQIFLEDIRIEEGYVLTCVANALEDCEIEVGPEVEAEFYNVFNEDREAGIDYK